MRTSRYKIQAPIGSGSMGAIHRAYDPLTGQTVALKQVLLPHGLTPAATEQELLALAHEFRVLAGLRHPHIISVLDYGFDDQRQPFYTMELLMGAQTILEAAQCQPLEARVELLTQALEALAYLHRRGILHHDLKPANMLVADGRLRLLDFGLAVLAQQPRADDAFGTLQYLAPEVLDAQPYTEQADLYSLGVIAYELLVGSHPFPAETVHDFFAQVCDRPPDLTPLAEHPALAQALAWLLAKTPEARPASAQAAIRALRAALGQPEPAEPGAIRESYLQAAAFVGRETELAQLTAALDRARQGQGSAWLVGGESGVGKSRLLDELRTQALVAGATVLRGQGLADSGGRPYELWRDPLRQLLIMANEIDDGDAGVLAQLVPDIAQLLGRSVEPAPELGGEAAQQRLFLAIARLFAAQPRPVLLILEDLQWADASLLPLPTLLRELAHRPALIIGTYRNDERPGLPRELPGMHALELTRLDTATIAELSGAILGADGQQPELIAFLARETEGNTFFIIEVLRELARSAGRLDAIAVRVLPETILPQRIEALALRRIARVPEAGQTLLQLAAVAGRELDLELLGALLKAPDALEPWLAACGDAAVLEITANRWRFSHDKIREALLASLSDDERAAAHRQVAGRLAELYNEQPAYAARLAYHWQKAGDAAEELRAAKTAGDYAIAQYLYAEGLAWYERAYQLAHLAADVEFHTQVNLCIKLAEQLVTHDPVRARALAEEALARMQHTSLPDGLYLRGMANIRRILGLVADQHGSYREAITQLVEARQGFQALGLEREAAALAHPIGTSHWHCGEYSQAEQYALEMLQAGEKLGDLKLVMISYVALAMVCEMLDRKDDEVAYEQRALAIARQGGYRETEARVLINHSVTLLNRNRLEEALHYCRAGLRVAQELGMIELIGHAQHNLANLSMMLDDLVEARRICVECLELIAGRGFHWIEVEIRITQAEILLRMGDAAACLTAIDAIEAHAQLQTKPILATLQRVREQAEAAFTSS